MRYLAAPAYVLGMMAVTIGPLLWFPRPSAPEWLSKKPVVAARPIETKDQSQVPLKPIRVTTIAYRLDPPVQKVALNVKPETSLPWSCETIRAATAKLSAEQIARLARVYRLTDQQKAEARRCLKERT